MEDLHFSRSDPESAMDYIISIMTTLKQTKMKIVQLNKDMELWKKRVKLAASKGRLELKSQATIMVENIVNDVNQLLEEERELVIELNSAKKHFIIIKNTSELTVDTDQLLAELEMLVGKEDKTETNFKLFEAEEELKKLKNDLKNNE